MSQVTKDIRLALVNYVKDWEDDEIKKRVFILLEALTEDLEDNGYEPDSSVTKTHKKLMDQIELIEGENEDDEKKDEPAEVGEEDDEEESVDVDDEEEE